MSRDKNKSHTSRAATGEFSFAGHANGESEYLLRVRRLRKPVVSVCIGMGWLLANAIESKTYSWSENGVAAT
jgi:hypothetical protein